MGGTLEFASTPPGQQTPSSVWWSDRALRRDSGNGVFPTGPVSRQAATPPSHRADEPPSARAPRRKTFPPRPHRAQCPSRTHRANAVSRYRRVPPFASSRRPPMRDVEAGYSATFVQCSCMLCLHPLGGSLRARASGAGWFVSVPAAVGGDRCAELPPPEMNTIATAPNHPTGCCCDSAHTRQKPEAFGFWGACALLYARLIRFFCCWVHGALFASVAGSAVRSTERPG